MKSVIAVLAIAPLVASGAPGYCAEPPGWAFAVNPPGSKPAPDDGSLQHLPGSTASFTLTQLRDLFNAPDWYPDDHPPMPDPVAHGSKPSAMACAFCHLPNGLGRPENASLAGLPAEYIIQQVAHFRSGARKSSLLSLPPKLMIATAASVSDADLKVAAEYFSPFSHAPGSGWWKPRRCRRPAFSGSCWFRTEAGEERAYRKSCDRDAGGRAAHRAARFPFRVCSVRAAGQPFAGGLVGHDRRRRQDGCVRDLSRHGFERRRAGAGACRTFTKLSVPSTLRHSAW